MFGMLLTTDPTHLPARRPGYFTGITVRHQDRRPAVVVINRDGKGDALVFHRERAYHRHTPVYRVADLDRLGDAARPLAWIGLPFSHGGPIGEVRWGPDTRVRARFSEYPGVPGTYTTYETEAETYVELALIFVT